MFGLETIRDALINFSAGTPSGQAYLANQREAAQQAQLFPLQLQMAQAQAAKARQDIETQGLKSKALAGVLSRIGGSGQQQPQGSPQLSQQDLTTLSLVDPDTAQSIIRAAQETRLQQEAALGKPAVYAIDTNTGNRIMLQPPTQGIQNFFSGAPTQTGQLAQSLGKLPAAPPVKQQPLAPLPSPTVSPTGYSPAASDALNADFEAMAAAQTPNTSGIAPVAQVPDVPLPTAYTAGTASPFGEVPNNPKSQQTFGEEVAKQIGQAEGSKIAAGGLNIPAGRAYDGARALFATGDTKEAAKELAKINENKMKAAGSLNSLKSKTDIVLGEIDKALELAGYNPKTGKVKDNVFTTGLGGAVSKYIPASGANSLANKFDTIGGNIGFDALQEMRANSPTGGALGNVSDKENATLKSLLGSLKVEQKTSDTIANLLRIKDIVKKRNSTFDAAFKKDFSGETTAPAIKTYNPKTGEFE